MGAKNKGGGVVCACACSELLSSSTIWGDDVIGERRGSRRGGSMGEK